MLSSSFRDNLSESAECLCQVFVSYFDSGSICQVHGVRQCGWPAGTAWLDVWRSRSSLLQWVGRLGNWRIWEAEGQVCRLHILSYVVAWSVWLFWILTLFCCRCLNIFSGFCVTINIPTMEEIVCAYSLALSPSVFISVSKIIKKL